MIIDFDEQKFRDEVKNMVRPLGLSKRQVAEIVSQALSAIRRASRPVKM
ncbi:hypothetical protein [Sporomusa sp.]|nr:hypothetical protein [Sporomusa sp.]HWR45067.1 hypothetical protein [Sporomusa sp.]